MPAHVEVRTLLESELLAQLGARLKSARVARGLGVSAVARELGISRTSVYAVEAGDPSVTMGTYLRVLGLLGLASDLVLLGTGASEHAQPPVQRQSLDRHRRQDLRSLELHKEAVHVLREQPDRAQRALQVLDRWEGSPDSHSQQLLDEWRCIIENSEWDRAVEDTERGRQLRQASPLGFVLDESTRNEIMRRFSRAALHEPLAA
jgi:transcriptional regulator with XRE-family HTH domain